MSRYMRSWWDCSIDKNPNPDKPDPKMDNWTNLIIGKIGARLFNAEAAEITEEIIIV
jgi:hypothetical protein